MPYGKVTKIFVTTLKINKENSYTENCHIKIITVKCHTWNSCTENDDVENQVKQ